MKKTIFLDAGGVILNEETHEHIRAGEITELIQVLKPDYSLDLYWNDVDEAVYRFVPGVYNYIIWKNTLDEKKYLHVKEEYSRQWKQIDPELILADNLEDMLIAVSDIFDIGILGQYDKKLKSILEKNCLLQYFTYTNTQDEFSITKPDPRYFEHVLSKAGVDPCNSIMVGDRIDKDIIPAKQIGMKTVRIRTGIHKNQQPRMYEEIPDIDIESITQLQKVLKSI